MDCEALLQRKRDKSVPNRRKKSYKCEVCDHYEFTQLSSLETHKRIHSEDKLFKCDVCNYACNHLGNLNRQSRS